jgi:signal transduction histidine kinase
MRAKIFFLTYLLFLVVFFASLTIISVLFYHTQTKLVMESTVKEHYLIAENISKELSTLIEQGAEKKAAIQYVYEFYAKHYQEQKGYIELYQEQALIHSSFGENSPGLTANFTNNKTVQLILNNNNYYVVVAGNLLRLHDPQFQIQFIYDVTATIDTWKSLRNILLLIGISFSLFLAVILNLLLHYVFKPMNQVIFVSQEIANGNYEQRIQLFKNEELNVLAKNFNNMAEKVQLAIRQLADEASQKQRFVDNFSHEIRTPLTSIYGFAEYLQKSILQEQEVIHISGYIMQDSCHILKIADRLLNLAVMNPPNLTKKYCSIQELFETVSSLIRNQLNEKQIHLIQDNQSNLIYGDPDLLQNLLVNLTNNAIDASEPGRNIVWQAYQEKEYTILSVSDEGKGMHPDEIARIHEPFYRVDKIRSRKSGNVGLGLSICYQIAKCHQANIVFQSELDIGTMVKVIFTTL